MKVKIPLFGFVEMDEFDKEKQDIAEFIDIDKLKFNLLGEYGWCFHSDNVLEWLIKNNAKIYINALRKKYSREPKYLVDKAYLTPIPREELIQLYHRQISITGI
jgi:hypothetical protein